MKDNKKLKLKGTEQWSQEKYRKEISKEQAIANWDSSYKAFSVVGVIMLLFIGATAFLFLTNIELNNALESKSADVSNNAEIAKNMANAFCESKDYGRFLDFNRQETLNDMAWIDCEFGVIAYEEVNQYYSDSKE